MNKIDITHKVLLFTMLSFSMLFSSSCNDEKDLTCPTLNLAFTSYNSKTNLCTYTLNTSDNTAIKSISIYKNDSLIYKNDSPTRYSVKNNSTVSASCKYTPNGYKIRAITEDFGGNITQDTLSAPFVSTVSSPKGGGSLSPGTIQTIIWTSNFPDKVNIQLFKDNIYSQTIATNVTNTGKYAWLVPANVTAGSNYKIRVSSSAMDAAMCFTSQFSVVPYIAISAPASNMNVSLGSNLYLAFTQNLTESIRLDLYKGSSVYLHIGSFNNSNYSLYYNWAVPTSLPVGSDYKIRISSSTNSAVYAETPLITINEIGTTTDTGYTLTKNETWSGTILLKGDIVVPAGITLTINPGTIINVSTGTPVYDGGSTTGKIDFYIKGNLMINGSAQNIIQIKSAASTPTYDDWEGIIMSGSRLEMTYCLISDSYYGVAGFSSSTAMKINNCLFNNILGYGIVDWTNFNNTYTYNSFINDCIFGYALFGNSNRNIQLNYSEFKNNSNDVNIIGSTTSITTNSKIDANYCNFSTTTSYNLYMSTDGGVKNSTITANYCYGISKYITNVNGNTIVLNNQRTTINSTAGCGFSSMAKSPSAPSYIIGNAAQKQRKMKELNEEIIQKSKEINRQLIK